MPESSAATDTMAAGETALRAARPGDAAGAPDIFQAIDHYAAQAGGKVFLQAADQRRSLTYAELRSHCARISTWFAERGIGPGHRVSVIGANSVETLLIFLGTLYHGAIINPINVDESPTNIRRILGLVRPRVVLYDRAVALGSEALGAAECISFGSLEESRESGGFFGGLPPEGQGSRNTGRNEDDLAEILFTSGTTSTPKGVCIARGPLHAMAWEIAEKMGITREDVLLEYRNYNWASAQLLTILSSVLKGATLVLARKFSRSRFPSWLEEFGVTIAAGVPTVINILAHEPVSLPTGGLGSMRFMTSSSAPLSVASQLAFERTYGIPIVQGMGMSEAGFMLGNPFEGRKTGSAGTPCKYKEVFFVKHDGERCSTGEEGEMVVRGYSMGLGYLQEDGRIDPFPTEGFRTGDLGYMDGDGFIFITGRAKDLIIRGGVNIAPAEITARIMEHPAVKDAATVGVPDSIYGEEVASFVVPKNEGSVGEEEVITHCRTTLPEFKVPKRVYLVDAIPRTSRGKVSKLDLLALLPSPVRRGTGYRRS